MMIRFTALRAKQPLGAFYSAVVPARDLLRVCQFDYRRLAEDGEPDLFMGVQRPYNRKRVRDIADYTDGVDACFPTSIVISVDERCVTIENRDADFTTITIHPYVDEDDHTQSIPISHAAWIIDGQHRLKGLEAKNADLFDLPTTVFIGADEPTRAALFSTVNLAQTKVNRSIVYDLFAVAEYPSPQKTCHEVTVSLDKLEFSPFYHRIMRLGAKTPNRGAEFLAQATVVRGMLQYISRNPDLDRREMLGRGKMPHVSNADRARLFLRQYVEAENDDALLDLMLNYFSAIRARWPHAWHSTEQGVMISRTNGYDGFMKFLPAAVSAVGGLPDAEAVPSEESFADVFAKSRLADEDFNVVRFRPGSSGASALARALREDLASS